MTKKKDSFIRLSSVSEEQAGSVESQVYNLTNRVSKLTYHLKLHSKDYSSQRGLWKILGKRKRLLVYLRRKSLLRYEKLINQLGIRVPKTVKFL
uniref:Small ribosomal subunit protein uS15c n=1 Tax=Huperzia lucidula TaxID=37429 RepID=A0A3Q9R3Y3_HUPLU|nr:ribosomal protein S15 [Huperzia crispata]YP_011031971.1 ribosomal protein S15 [Huperzia kunmingensis]AZU95502.1 ribosomal protein S15 [Huperzia lucidula]WRB00908.1 ribosomal protein S15 [Huperzia sp. DW-2023a]WRB00994.1 ribosomal protein S15 [Huperzia serrata f. longipetiolata]WRB01256.1 ribosomal protein S15 [Huperzia selago]WRB01342.1 ribosomal protein S15 [Huperzia serrata]